MDRKLLLLIFLVYVQKLYSLDIQVSGKELGLYFRPEYNRAFYFCSDIAAVGGVELNGRYAVKGGLAAGNTGSDFDIKAFTRGEAALPLGIPLSFSLAYMYNGLPSYETHTHALLPLVSLKGQWAGISLGPNLRLTSFFGGTPVFESMLSVSVYANFFISRILRLGLRCANFSDFAAESVGSYFFNVNGSIRLNERVSLVNEVEMLQSGSSVLSANFYGIAYRGGISFSW